MAERVKSPSKRLMIVWNLFGRRNETKSYDEVEKVVEKAPVVRRKSPGRPRKYGKGEEPWSKLGITRQTWHCQKKLREDLARMESEMEELKSENDALAAEANAERVASGELELQIKDAVANATMLQAQLAKSIPVNDRLTTILRLMGTSVDQLKKLLEIPEDEFGALIRAELQRRQQMLETSGVENAAA